MVTKREESPALKRKRDNNLNESAPPLSWEILNLISHYMEPETLAIASCVSTTWWKCFSSENLWKSQLIKHYPSLFHISMKTNPGLSYKHLFSVFTEPDAKRKNQWAKPKISLSDLMFIFHVSTGSKTATVVTHGKDLTLGSDKDFEMEIDLISNRFTKDMIMKEVKLKVQVVYKNFEKVLTIGYMADIIRSLNTTYGWFTGVLPATENCFSGVSGIGGYIKPRFNDDNILDNFSFFIINLTRPDFNPLMVHNTLKYFQCVFS